MASQQGVFIEYLPCRTDMTELSCYHNQAIALEEPIELSTHTVVKAERIANVQYSTPNATKFLASETGATSTEIASSVLTSTEDALVLVQEQMLNAVRSCADETAGLATSVVDAALFHLERVGHQVRARIALGACMALGVDLQQALTLASASELLHNASLVHDDLQDQDTERRGQQAVWVKYDANTAICTGDLLLSCSYGVLAQYQNQSLVGALLRRMHARTAQAVLGQNADLSYQNKALYDLAVYQNIVIAKSGALLSLPLELALIAAGQETFCAQACQAAQAFSLGYQIIDDLDDYASDQLRASGQVLNVLQVLGHKVNIASAQAQASQLAREQLEQSISLARALPSDSGALLIQIAQKLLARL
jgi:geranylgeranyl pyrophosphate synthase